MVKPGLLSPVMLNTIQMFLPVVHVVLKGPVTVVAVVSLAHGASYIFQPGMRHTLYLCGTENRRKRAFHECPDSMMTEQLYSYTATAFIIQNHSQEMSQPIHEAIHLFICRQYTDCVWFRHVRGPHLQPTVILVFVLHCCILQGSLQTPYYKFHHSITRFIHCRFDLEIRIIHATWNQNTTPIYGGLLPSSD